MTRTSSEPVAGGTVGARYGSLVGRSRSRTVTATTPTLGTTSGSRAGTGTVASSSLLTPPLHDEHGKAPLPLPIPTSGSRRVVSAPVRRQERLEEEEDRTVTQAQIDGSVEEDDEPEVRRGKVSPKPKFTSTPRPPVRTRESRDREGREGRDKRSVTEAPNPVPAVSSDAFVDMQRRYDRLMADIARFRTRLDKVRVQAQTQTRATRPSVVHRTRS